MTCKDAEKLIQPFMEDDLEIDELREFMEHIEDCLECKEELSIQFLVSEGLSRLESGNVFNLQNELKLQMHNAENALQFRESMQWLLYALEGLVAVAAATLVALIFIL